MKKQIVLGIFALSLGLGLFLGEAQSIFAQQSEIDEFTLEEITVTTQPKLDKYEVSGTLEYGNYSLLHTEGVMNAPLSGKTALRASFTTSIRDGYLTNGTDNEDSKAARLRFLLEPYESLSLTVTAELSRGQGVLGSAAG